MAASLEWRCAVTDLPPGRTAKFRLQCGEQSLDGFVVSHERGYSAFVNRCAHVGTPLDLWPNEFLSDDGRTIVCATHGAIYEPIGGRCTGGPCVGATLTPLPLRREGGDIVVTCPRP